MIRVTPNYTHLKLRLEAGSSASWKNPFSVSDDEQNRAVLALIEKEGRFALSYGKSVAQAQ